MSRDVVRRHGRRRALRWLGLALAATVALAGCGFLGGQTRTAQCGGVALLECNTLLEIGLDAVALGRTDEPAAIVATDACAPDVLCASNGALGGPIVAVAVQWRDGSVAWATIPLPPDWPEGEAGPATRELGPVPRHLIDLLTSSGLNSAN